MSLVLLVVMLFTVGSVFIFTLLVRAGVVTLSMSDAQAITDDIMVAGFGIVWLSFGVLYALVTAAVFRRYRGADLARVARASGTRSLADRITLILMGGDEIVFPVVTMLMSLAGVIWLVLYPEFTSSPALIIGAIAALVGGWIMMIVSFTTSYVREWASRDSIRFPRRKGVAEERRFGDFVYVAVQFATAFAPADVQLLAPRVRTIATINSIVAFLFNTVIIGMFLSFAVAAGFDRG